MGSTTTVRIERETAELLKKRGHKGETYDQIIRRMLGGDLLLELEKLADSDEFVSADKVPWDRLDEIDVDEL